MVAYAQRVLESKSSGMLKRVLSRSGLQLMLAVEI